MTEQTITVNGKKYTVKQRTLENGVIWLYCIRGRHGYAIASLGEGRYGKVNFLF